MHTQHLSNYHIWNVSIHTHRLSTIILEIFHSSTHHLSIIVHEIFQSTVYRSSLPLPESNRKYKQKWWLENFDAGAWNTYRDTGPLLFFHWEIVVGYFQTDSLFIAIDSCGHCCRSKQVSSWRQSTNVWQQERRSVRTFVDAIECTLHTRNAHMHRHTCACTPREPFHGGYVTRRDAF